MGRARLAIQTGRFADQLHHRSLKQLGVESVSCYGSIVVGFLRTADTRFNESSHHGYWLTVERTTP